jgi:hypothetical protein
MARETMLPASLCGCVAIQAREMPKAGNPWRPGTDPNLGRDVDLSAWKRREEAKVADRTTKERKLVALMVNDLGAENEPDMVRIEEEAHALSDEELDRTLAGRLDLPYPVDEEVMDRALAHVEEPEELSERGPGGFTGAPDLSHEPRPEEREV